MTGIETQRSLIFDFLIIEPNEPGNLHITFNYTFNNQCPNPQKAILDIVTCRNSERTSLFFKHYRSSRAMICFSIRKQTLISQHIIFICEAFRLLLEICAFKISIEKLCRNNHFFYSLIGYNQIPISAKFLYKSLIRYIIYAYVYSYSSFKQFCFR